MIGKDFGWAVMTLLALAVASYAAALLLEPELRHPLVRTLFSERPVATIAHFVGSALALAIGAFQLNSRLRARFIAVHRWAGRLYVLGVIVGGLAGFFLALHSSAGIVAQMGFGLLAMCWVGSTFTAYWHIRAGNLSAHRRWMIRGFALTWAAVTLRIYLPISQTAGVPIAVAYPAISWLCWVPNLLFAEWFVWLTRGVLPNNSFMPKPLRGSA
jgi:hypothetical protein